MESGALPTQSGVEIDRRLGVDLQRAMFDCRYHFGSRGHGLAAKRLKTLDHPMAHCLLAIQNVLQRV